MVAHKASTLRIGVLMAMLWSAAAVAGAASGAATRPSSVELVFRSLIPLGTESFLVQPWHSVLTVLASAQSPYFEGWRRISVGERHRLLDADGQPVRFFPRHIEFRVSAGTMTRISDAPPYPMRSALSQNDYLLNLRFRVKVFHGLRQRTIEPESVALIGEPADIPYEERIYRVAFDLDNVPMADRVVLEVVAPGGERLCKFHLDLE